MHKKVFFSNFLSPPPSLCRFDGFPFILLIRVCVFIRVCAYWGSFQHSSFSITLYAFHTHRHILTHTHGRVRKTKSTKIEVATLVSEGHTNAIRLFHSMYDYIFGIVYERATKTILCSKLRSFLILTSRSQLCNRGAHSDNSRHIHAQIRTWTPIFPICITILWRAGEVIWITEFDSKASPISVTNWLTFRI